MAEIKKYKKGQTVWYLVRTRCEVLENTLKPGEGNLEEAVLFLRSAQGSSIVVPVAFQDQFVTDKSPTLAQKIFGRISSDQ